MIQVVVLLQIIDEAEFQQYEGLAIRTLDKYQGRLLTAFRPLPDSSTDESIDEVHTLSGRFA